MLHPHFDENIVIWDDAYSGRYQPPPEGYCQQFELQWKMALDKRLDYACHPGACTDEDYIADRIYEWTGRHPKGTGFKYDFGGVRVLDHPIAVEWIQEKDCIDIACGMGRWTKVMQALGAKSVTSVDISESALQNVRQFNPNTFSGNIMEIPREYPQWIGRFDFVNLWGVAMATHNPLRAFLSAACTVKPGGRLYMMVYSPEGMHGTTLVNVQRKKFHRLKTIEERLAFVDDVYHRKWDKSYSLLENIKNYTRNLRKLPKGGKIGVLDMLEPYYNWVIPLRVIYGWMDKGGFRDVIILNEFEKPKCAYHVMGIKQ